MTEFSELLWHKKSEKEKTNALSSKERACSFHPGHPALPSWVLFSIRGEGEDQWELPGFTHSFHRLSWADTVPGAGLGSVQREKRKTRPGHQGSIGHRTAWEPMEAEEAVAWPGTIEEPCC